MTQQIYKELHRNNVKPVIAINGRGFYKSSVPKDPEYGKRWAVERVFSHLKEGFWLSRNTPRRQIELEARGVGTS